VGADDEDDVVAMGQVVLMQSEGFAEEALDAISARGGADGFGDSEAEPRVGKIVGAGIGDEGPLDCFAAGFEDRGKLGAGADAVGFGEAIGLGHGGILATDGAGVEIRIAKSEIRVNDE
jgi:hypothetical protein